MPFTIDLKRPVIKAFWLPFLITGPLACLTSAITTVNKVKFANCETKELFVTTDNRNQVGTWIVGDKYRILLDFWRITQV